MNPYKNMKSKTIFSLLCALGMLALAGQANAALIVTNGNFQNLAGLAVTGGGWYGGVPTGWSGLSYPGYEILDAGSGNYIANLQQLASTSQYLSQSVGTTDLTGNVTLTFDLPGTLGTTYTVGVVIARGPIGNNDVLIYAPFTNVTGTQTLTATNVASGTPLSVGFFYLSYVHAPALDNVSISQIPEPSSVALLGVGLASMAFLRRRRR